LDEQLALDIVKDVRPGGHETKKKSDKYKDTCNLCAWKWCCNRKPLRDDVGRCMTFRSIYFMNDMLERIKVEMRGHINDKEKRTQYST